MRRPALVLCAAVLGVGLVACQDEKPAETQSFFEAQQAEQPAAERPGAGQDLPPGHPAVGTKEGEPVLTGTVQVSETLKDKAPAGVLFLIARAPVAEGRGPALLVRRVASPTFPYAFQLTTGDVMGQGAGLPEKLLLEAHLDQDGDAISRTPGDLTGQLKAPVAAGSSGLEVVLDEQVTEGKAGMKVQDTGAPRELPAGHPPVGAAPGAGDAAKGEKAAEPAGN